MSIPSHFQWNTSLSIVTEFNSFHLFKEASVIYYEHMGFSITTWQAYPCSTGQRILFTNTHTLWMPFDGKGSNATWIPLFHYGTTVYQFSKAPIDKLPSHNCFQYGWMELIYSSLYCSLFLKENPWSIHGVLSLRTYHCTYRDASQLGHARSFCNDWAIA